MTKAESNLEKLKESYLDLQKKYGLPDFDNFNKEFGIERASDVETDFVIREIRKIVSEKLSNYLRFVETILHPINTPMFVFSIIKSIGIKEKDILTEIYTKLAKIEIRLIELDLSFVEEKEVIFIRDSYNIWQEIKKDLLDVFGAIQLNLDNKFEVNNRGYFG
ncbi:MAG: hypothetical protein KKF48_00520 [Nanoarchaeota archaeon]|nr:hypothetical protein [Nanoarchaeota archaeon]MBU1027509.1 hypothetical protein [Nanoarchaeota archaeon]